MATQSSTNSRPALVQSISFGSLQCYLRAISTRQYEFATGTEWPAAASWRKQTSLGPSHRANVHQSSSHEAIVDHGVSALGQDRRVAGGREVFVVHEQLGRMRSQLPDWRKIDCARRINSGNPSFLGRSLGRPPSHKLPRDARVSGVRPAH
jgi:hypothetical protein